MGHASARPPTTSGLARFTTLRRLRECNGVQAGKRCIDTFDQTWIGLENEPCAVIPKDADPREACCVALGRFLTNALYDLF